MVLLPTLLVLRIPELRKPLETPRIRKPRTDRLFLPTSSPAVQFDPIRRPDDFECAFQLPA
jgi:hypothetical protein